MAPTGRSYPYNIRLRGNAPVLEADGSNLVIRVDNNNVASSGAIHTYVGSNPSLAFDLFDGGNVRIAATPVAFSNLPETWPEPYVSFCTTQDVERMRIDARGLTCGTLNAGVFTNLVSNFESNNDAFKPPTGQAFTTAYVTLSNLI